MGKLRIGFLVESYGPGSTSRMPVVMRALAEAGVLVEVIHPKGRLTDLAAVRVEHDLYVLKRRGELNMSLAGALHALGAAIVNPYPATVALGDKLITASILRAAGIPAPASYVASRPEDLSPLLESGPLILKPYRGGGGRGIRVVHNPLELAAVPPRDEPVFAQRYHDPEGRDRKMYVIGDRVFGVKKVFPARTEAEKHGEPYVPSPELADIARRCGRAFGIDLYGVDIIESEGKPYVVDIQSLPGFKGVPDAPVHMAGCLYAAALRAAAGQAPGESRELREAVCAT
jgi:ribosomal protein S6--L-glutamate ligase